MHPFGCQRHVLHDLGAFFGGQVFAQALDALRCDMRRPQTAQRLDHQPAEPTGRRHIARRGALEADLRGPHFDAACGAVGEEYHLGRYLLRQAKQICRVHARGLQPQPVLAPHLVFKGGTSLSKVFGVIDRFSEDIDLCLLPEFVGANAAGFDALTSRVKRDAAVLEMQRLCGEKAQR